MSKSYYLHNMGYINGDKPLNLKHIVIDILRKYGIFIHMRDEKSGLYDLKDFLYETNPIGIPYHRDNIRRAEKGITAHQQRLKDLAENGDQLYQQYYDEGKAKYEAVIASNRYYKEYKSEADRLKNILGKLQNFNSTFYIEGQSDLTKEVLNNISDCIEAVEEDYQDNLQRAEENDIVNPEPYQPLSKKEWLEKEKKESNHKINFYKERIEEEKKIIEGLKEKDKIIKAIFAALEPYDIEEKSTDD